MNPDDLNGEAPSCSMDQHFEDVRRWMESTNALNDKIQDMGRHMENLNYLPLMLDEIRSMRNDLVGAATGRSHLPLAAILPVIAGMAFCIAILGGLLFTSQPNSRNISIRPSGIDIHGPSTSENHPRS